MCWTVAYLIPLTDTILLAFLEEALVVWNAVLAVDEATESTISIRK